MNEPSKPGIKEIRPGRKAGGSKIISGVMAVFAAALTAPLLRQLLWWVAVSQGAVEGYQVEDASEIPVWLSVATLLTLIVPFFLYYKYFKRAGHRLQVESDKAYVGEPNEYNKYLILYSLPMLVLAPIVFVFILAVL